MASYVCTYGSGCGGEGYGPEEAEVISRVESVPDGAQHVRQHHAQAGRRALVADTTQPDRRLYVPAVQ